MVYMIDRYPSPDSPRLGAMILRPEAESVPRARRWFRKFIAPYNPACSVDDCALMISELVTNAIVHGQPEDESDAETEDEWRVRVEWFRDDTDLRVEVHSPGSPTSVQMRRPPADDTHGRGLLLVDSIADSWHYGPSPFGGTKVSFVVADAWPLED